MLKRNFMIATVLTVLTLNTAGCGQDLSSAGLPQQQPEKTITEGVVNDNVETDAQKIDNKQLEVTSVKEVSLGNQSYVWGWYDKESILTATDITSLDLVIKNLVTDTERKVNISRLNEPVNSIVDYKNKKLLLDLKGDFGVYNLDTNRFVKLSQGPSQVRMTFVDANGDYILANDNESFLLVDTHTGESYPLGDARLKDYNEQGMQSSPFVAMMDDHETIYYTNKNKIYKTSIKDSEKSILFTELTDASTVLGMQSIKGESTLITNKLDKNYKGSLILINTINKEIKPLQNIQMGDRPQDMLIANYNNSINRIIYGQTDAKTGLNEIFIGEIKGTAIGRSRSVLAKEIGKQQLYWTGMWNDNGTKVLINLYKPQNQIPYTHYLIGVSK